MNEGLLQRLHTLVPLNPSQEKELCKNLHQETLPKNTYLLEAGGVANYIYFVVSGVIRSFKQVEGKEVTTWFSFPNHFAVPYFSFAYRQPSQDSLILLHDSQLLSISHKTLDYLLSRDKVWIDINRRLLEEYYTSLQNRVTSFQVQSAKERYESILKEHPDIEEKVSLGHLASYLGISQETLSRLRARKKKKAKI
jgi:CRP-like cAMP-binding protein